MSDWIECNLPYYSKSYYLNNEKKNDSFSGLGLNKPGTLIEVQVDGKIKQYLIGHINCLTGVCDDCCAFEKDEATVLRYKVVWEES